jgi:glycosyltransferase involved in cell wall biosynthesis
MQIGIDARYLDRRFPGIGTYCRDLIASLLNTAPGLRVHLFVNKPVLAQKALNHFPQHVEPYVTFTKQPQSASSFLFDPREMRRFVKDRNLDVLHVPHWYPNCRVPCKLVSTIHDVNPLECPPLRSGLKRWFFKASIRKVCRHSDGIVFISNATKNSVRKYFDFDDRKTAVIPNMIDASVFGGTDSMEPTERYVLHVCGAGKFNKNTAAAIDAFTTLKEERAFADLRLYVIGRLSPRARQTLSGPVARSVVVWNHVPRERLLALYRNAQCLLFPSLCEGFGLPIVEAMASSCPVVTSNLSATAEIGRDDAACLVDPRSIADIAAGLRAVLLDKALRQNMIEKGLARIREYAPQTVGPQLIGFYETVLSS